jgi:hypothetical protein
VHPGLPSKCWNRDGTRRGNVIDVSFNALADRIVVLIDGANTDPANPDGYLDADVRLTRNGDSPNMQCSHLAGRTR